MTAHAEQFEEFEVHEVPTNGPVPMNRAFRASVVPAKQPPKPLKVSSHSDVGPLAGAITETMKRHGACEMRAIGAAAVNQAMKALAISRGQLVTSGIDVVMRPSFYETVIEGRPMSGLSFILDCA
jgi:stage V sporulation protein S